MRVLVLLCLLAWPVPAWAQSQQAADLFTQGLEAMKKSDWATACPAIAESFRLEPLPGALFTLAECHAREGKLASAMQEFERYLALVEALPLEEQAEQEERVQVTKRRRGELEPRVPRLTIELSGELPSDGFVELDGAALKTEQLGVPLPLDPGAHRVLVRVGARESDASVTLAEGELRRVRLELPRAPPPAPPPPPPVPTPIPNPLPAPDVVVAEQPGTSGWWIAGWTSIALGGVGFVVAASTGVVLLGKKDTIEANCTGTTCNDIGFAEAEDVPTLDNLGTSAFIVGGLLTAAGVVMLLLSSDDETNAAGSPFEIRW